MEIDFKKAIQKEWKRNSNLFPDKIEANYPEFCPIPTTRAVFSKSSKFGYPRTILDIEDIVGNNIRIVEKEEAEWLIKVLENYVNGLQN